MITILPTNDKHRYRDKYYKFVTIIYYKKSPQLVKDIGLLSCK